MSGRDGRPESPSDRARRRREQVKWQRAALAGSLVVVAVVVVVLVGSLGSSVRASDRHIVAAQHGSHSVTSRDEQPVDPALFSPGSCMSFAPTGSVPRGGDARATVFLDAGHGGLDPGAVGRTESGQAVHEADETLPTELDTMALLRGQGYRVVVSRTSASSVARLGPGDVSDGELTVQGSHNDVAARDVCADRAGANILVGIYFDAGASPADAGSVTAYDAVRPFSTADLRLADLVQRDVLDSLNAHGWGIPNDGVTSDAYLGGPPDSPAAADYGHLLLLGPAMPGYFTTPSEMPGTLIEPLFITDPFEATIAASRVGQESIAQGIDRAVQEYFAPPRRPSG